MARSSIAASVDAALHGVLESSQSRRFYRFPAVKGRVPRTGPGAISGSGRTPMFYLLANNGPQAGRKYELKGDKWILGRHPDCDVVIEVGAVSRNHCQIVREGNA